MSNPNIYVLCSINRVEKPYDPFLPYTVLFSPTPSLDRLWRIYDGRKNITKGGKRKTEEKLEALQNIFEKEKKVGRFFQLRYKERDNYNDENEKILEKNKLEVINNDAVIQDTTSSVLLGLYLSLLHDIEGKRFNSRWNTITVTGDIIIEDDKVKLLSIGDELEKFNDYKSEILKSQNICDKNLFVYVCNKENKDIKSEKNIKVKYFHPNNPIEDVVNCVFEKQFEDEFSEYLYHNMRGKGREIEYIETRKYSEVISEMLPEHKIGYFIWGAGNSGKSDMAEELVKHLINEKKDIYAPIWIDFKNDESLLFQEEYSEITLKKAAEEYLAKQITKIINISKRDRGETEIHIQNIIEFLQDHKYLLVIDNLEFDNVNDVLMGIQSFINKIDKKGNMPYLIITSRPNASNISKMALISIETQLIKEDIEEFLHIIIGTEKFENIKQNEKYSEFMSLLYNHYRASIRNIIALLNRIGIDNESISEILPEVKSMRNENIEEQDLMINRSAFSKLDEFAQNVLFIFMDNISPDSRFEHSELIKKVKIKYPDKSESDVREAIKKLIARSLIYKENKNDLLQYGMKGPDFLAIMFGNIFNNQNSNAKEIKETRKNLIRADWRFHMTLRYERQKKIIDELLEEINNNLKIAEIYFHEALFKNPNRYITESISYCKKAKAETDKESKENINVVKQYLQTLNRATRIKESWDELEIFLDEINDDLPNPELQREIGDARYSLGFYINRLERHYELADKAYENAIKYYVSENYDDDKIREILIKKSHNLSALSEIKKREENLAEAERILTNNKYFDKLEFNQENYSLINAEREKTLADIYLRLAVFKKDKELKEKAKEGYFKALNIYKKINNSFQTAYVLAEISVVHVACEPIEDDLKQSIEAAEEALKVLTKEDYPVYYAETKNHIGNAYQCYLTLDDISKEMKEYYSRESYKAFHEAEQIFEKRRKYYFIAGRIQHNIGKLYLSCALKSDDVKEKYEYFDKSVNILNKAKELRKETPRYYILSLLYQGRAFNGKAITFYVNKERINFLLNAIEILETGIDLYDKNSFNDKYDFIWLHHHCSIAYFFLNILTPNSKYNEKVQDYKAKSLIHANSKDKENIEKDYKEIIEINIVS